MSWLRLYAGVFLVSACTLALQLIETRILSVVSWYHLAFFVISLAMFGLTAGAVWVYRKGSRFGEKTLGNDLSYFTTAFSLATAVSVAIGMSLAPAVLLSVTMLVTWTCLALCLALPFFFSGVVLSLAITRSPCPIGKIYAADLLGAAAGCVGVLVLLNATDGPSAVLWVAAVIAWAAALFSRCGIGEPSPERRTGSWFRRPEATAVLLMLAAAGNGLTQRGLQPAVVKGEFENRSAILHEEWNSFSRVAVYRHHPKAAPDLWGPSPLLPSSTRVDQIGMNIDGLAATSLFRFDGDPAQVDFLKYDLTNLAYFLPNRRRAAIIDVGGRRDLLSAWVFGFRDVTGVEINPAFVKLLTRNPRFAPYAGLGQLPGIASSSMKRGAGSPAAANAST